MDTTAALERFRLFYNEFSAAWIERLEELYAPGFAFKDPFHTVNGDFELMRSYFTRVLTALAESKFTVDDIATGSDGSYVRWHWQWRRRAKDPQRTVPGVTHLRFAPDGRITFHNDLFDAAEGFYETLPVVGGMLRTIKRRL